MSGREDQGREKEKHYNRTQQPEEPELGREAGKGQEACILPDLPDQRVIESEEVVQRFIDDVDCKHGG